MLVEAVDVTKSYGRGRAAVRALDGVSVAIRPGRLTAITGPSGSGKTTLLHCLAGVLLPDTGSVRFDGRDLASMRDRHRTRLRAHAMGFVLQRRNLLGALTVGENVDLPLVLAGADRDAVSAGTAAALERVRLGGRARAYPDELSGGELQRVAVARAIVGAPRVIWADEPTGALDSAAAEGVLELLKDVAHDGTTVVLVTHDPVVASHAVDVVALRDGRRVA